MTSPYAGEDLRPVRDMQSIAPFVMRSYSVPMENSDLKEVGDEKILSYLRKD